MARPRMLRKATRLGAGVAEAAAARRAAQTTGLDSDGRERPAWPFAPVAPAPVAA